MRRDLAPPRPVREGLKTYMVVGLEGRNVPEFQIPITWWQYLKVRRAWKRWEVGY